MRRTTWAKVAAVGTVAALTALGGQSVASAEQGSILGAGSKNAIEGSYIVVLKAGTATGAESKAHASEYDAKVTRTYKSVLHGYAAKMSEADAKQLSLDSSVAYVEQDQKVSVNIDQPNPPSWGLDRIDQRDLPLNNNYSYSTTASNVTAYVIDTGIRTTHQDFGGRAMWGTNTTGDGNNTDCHGHGTHVAGTVGGTAHGVAKGVKLVAVKVLNCQGSGSNAGVIAGIDWVTGQHAAGAPAVANMSLGGGENTSLETAVRNSIADGVSYAVASGNGDIFGNPQDACGFSPAGAGGSAGPAITVNASDRNDARATFSNYGTCTDLYAPGVGITSAWSTSDTATNTISGTSMATPHVAGAAALYLAGTPSATPAQVKSHINSTATPGKINEPANTPDRLLFTGSGGTEPPPPGCTGTNGTNVSIPDYPGAAVTSTITIGNCNRNASASSTVKVDIKHTWRGDLVVDLIAPNGAVVNLKPSSASDSADNVNTTYTRNLSAYAANGAWKLRVRDVYRYDTGYIDTWTFTG